MASMKLIPQLTQGTPKPGWTPQLQATRLAAGLRQARMSLAFLFNDESELRSMQASEVNHYEIDELQNYLMKHHVGKRLVDSLDFAKGDLGEICQRIQAAADPGAPPLHPVYGNKLILGYFFPKDVDMNHMMPFSHLDFVSDSTASFPKSKSGNYGYEWFVNQAIPEQIMKKHFQPLSGATLSSLREHLMLRKTYWAGRRQDGDHLPLFVIMWSGNDFFGNKMRLIDGTPAEIEELKRRAEALAEMVDSMPGPTILLGPGSSKTWSTDPRFDELAAMCLLPFKSRDVMIVNPDPIYANMAKRDGWHFQKTD